MDTSTILISIFAVAAVGCFGWVIWRLSENKAKREKQNILDAAEREKDIILKSRGKVLWLLYLSEISLQASVSALYGEQVRSKGLKKDFEETVNKYQEFHTNVQTRAKRRLVNRGIGTALSLVPGLGLLDLLTDLVDINNDVEGATEGIDFAKEALNRFSSGVETEFSHISNDDEIPITLTPDEQRVFKETFEQNIGSVETLNASTLNSCVKGTIRDMESSESIQLMAEEEREAAVAKIFEKVEGFITKYYDYHQVCKEQSEENAARSETE